MNSNTLTSGVKVFFPGKSSALILATILLFTAGNASASNRHHGYNSGLSISLGYIAAPAYRHNTVYAHPTYYSGVSYYEPAVYVSHRPRVLGHGYRNSYR